MRNLRKRILAVAMTAVLAIGSISYPGTADVSQAAESGNTTLTDESQLGDYRDDLAYQRVGVHDPSVIQDPQTGRYYLFGSHCAWAYSDDLENWTAFTNNITEDSAVTIFRDEIAWCQKANASYTIAGNLWAPDIVWSEPMQKWCMYMSINGPDWNSTISLLTADKLNGNWTYVGPVIQSGMSKGYGKTFDFTKVTGESSVPARYTDNVSRSGNPTLEAHAIDPCVLYDDEGDLWMTYGSWSGGISMIKLDPSTGLRDYSMPYKDTNNAVGEDGLISDPYTGYKIAGGTAVSGEGSYIQKIGEYYFLFLSYGGYAPEGGYNMRIFRSKDIKGPYKDALDKDARTVVNGKAGDTAGTTGMRLISYYKWNFAPYGHTAQGHNSATVDPASGKAFVIYHNKYNDGTAAHEVRTHQLLLNEDGWILAAPFEYAGETMSAKGYSQELFTGDYGIMFQKPNVDATKLECAEEQGIQLETGTEVKNEAGEVTGYTGTISGDYTGTWTSTADTPYISLKIGNTTYKGVFCEGTMDETDVKVMTFTAVGDLNQECLWGYKTNDPTQAIRMTIDKQINLPDTVVTDLKLPAVGVGGSKITWKSNSVAISDDGKVFYLKDDATAVMTATVSCGGYAYSKDYAFTVAGSDTLSEQTEIPLKTFYKNKELDLTTLKQGQCPGFVNPYHDTTEDLSKGVVISFDVTRTAASDRLSNIISFNNKLGKFYFTGGSYLGYNDFNNHYFDANLKTGYVAGTDYLETNKKVTIKLEITPEGVTVYKDGKEAYSTATLKAGETDGSFSAPNGKDNNAETTVLSWIKTAPELNFGFGNFWADIFKGKISNVVCAYIQPAIEVNGSSSSSSLSGVYTQDYEKVTDVSEEWTSPNASDQLAIGEDSEHGKFFLFSIDSGVSGNRSAQNLFGTNVEWPDNYQLEFDLGLKSGNVAERSESQFAIVSDTSFTANAIASNDKCILSLNCPQQTTGGVSTTWQINGDAETTVEIPSADTTAGGWVHVILTGGRTTGSGTLTIKSGDTSLYDSAVTLPADKTPTGFFVLNGRGSGLTKVDNISLKEQGADYANLSNYNIILDRAKQFKALQEESSCFTTDTYTALTGAITTAEETVNSSMTSDDQSTVDAQAAALLSAIEGLKRTTYTVTVEASANGSVTGLAADGKYNAGDSLSLTAQPSEGYVLSEWKIGSESAGNSIVYSSIVKENITITPVFAEAADLTEFNRILKEAQEKIAGGSYVGDSLLALQKAIIEARIAVPANLPATKQSTVTKYISELNEVIGELVEAPTVEAVMYQPDLTLQEVTLPDGWEWKQPDTKLSAGTKQYTVIYKATGEEFDISVMVNKATDPSYTLPEGLTGVEGTSLNAVALPENWKWKNPAEKLSKDKAKYTAIFTHSSGNYEPLEVEVPVTVTAAAGGSTGSGNTGSGSGTDGQKATISLSRNSVTLYTGKASKSVTVKATVTGASQSVTWSSSNKKVATVSNGTIKAVKKGTATITATANGVSATVKVTVKNPTIKVKKGKKAVSKVTVKKKKSVKLTVTVSPAKSGMSLVKISAKNKKIAKVTFKKGKLTIKGKKKGKFTIKIKSGKATKSVKVTVK